MDNKYSGLKVYLNGEDIMQEFSDKRSLFETGDLSHIYPLITQLTVHDAIFKTTKEEEKFTKELRNVIQKALGPVLNISKIPFSESLPEIPSGNWRVLLDVPEIEDLDVFKKSRLPNNFFVEVPSVHRRLHVTFYCTKCRKDGHTRLQCTESIETETKVAADADSVKREDSTIKIPSKPSTSGFYIGDREESRERDIAPNKSLLKIKNIKEFESEIGKEEVLKSLKVPGAIKKEVEESCSSDINSGMKRQQFSGKEDEEPNTKRAPIFPFHDIYSDNPAKASSTTNDADSLEILDESSPSTSLKNQLNLFALPSTGELINRNSVDDSVSTSNQPAPIIDTIKSELPSTDENDSDSNPGTSRLKPARQRKKPVQGIPIVIPDRIKEIISEIEDGVLNVDQLTAFFNHVKKKSKPCSFAKLYTPDVVGLKKQLEEIKTRYYMTPTRGSNEELQFMKWFLNILDRFDGPKPSTRKKKATA